MYAQTWGNKICVPNPTDTFLLFAIDRGYNSLNRNVILLINSVALIVISLGKLRVSVHPPLSPGYPELATHGCI